MTIGERIRNERIKKGWTQNDLAWKLGYADKGAISLVELGRRPDSVSPLCRLGKSVRIRFMVVSRPGKELFPSTTQSNHSNLNLKRPIQLHGKQTKMGVYRCRFPFRLYPRKSVREQQKIVKKIVTKYDGTMFSFLRCH